MKIEAFEDVLLEDTFVFSWRQSSESLVFEVLASLLQSHPDAAAPASGDWACYRPALIEFAGVSSVSGLLPQEAVSATRDASGTVDYGCIDELSCTSPGNYRIAGEFGVVTVAAERVSLLLSGAA